MHIKILIFSSLIFLSLCSVSESNQTCAEDYIKISFMSGSRGKVSIIYDRKGTVTYGPENGAVLETKQIDPKQAKSYWLIAENVTEKVKSGKYGVIENLVIRKMDIEINICNKIHSYNAIKKRKDAEYSEMLSELLDKQPR